MRHRPFVLTILDGWGYREEREQNAIAAAHKPCWDNLWKNYPHTVISGSGLCVGLPAGQMGNSEVGHLHMGAGRTIFQELTRIDQAIADESFFNNPTLIKTLEQAKNTSTAVHILGLLSSGGVHSHEQHIQALVKLASKVGVNKVYLHMFLDGRDTPPQSAKSSLASLQQLCHELDCGKVVSVLGRYYAMDRDKRWDRVQKAYSLLCEGQAEIHCDDVLTALELAYQRGETDEFVQATSIHPADEFPITIQDHDHVVFMNFRADRARELTQALLNFEINPNELKTIPLKLQNFVTLTEYDERLNVSVVFKPNRLTNTLGEYISHLGLKQLRIAETEKYAHVTFFFNGGKETPYTGEERILIPSPKLATYDLQPEMSAEELTNRLTSAIASEQFDVIICNFANPDMVGHTGNFLATVKAIEMIDHCLEKIITALQKVDGEMIITADHGNAELMFDEKTQQAHTAHTVQPVPVLYIGRPASINNSRGTLGDIAPTILHLMGLPQPTDMTGQSLFKLNQT